MKRAWTVAVVVAAVLLIGGGAAAWVFLGAVTPEEAVAAVVDKLDTVSSYRFTMQGTVESGGQGLDMQFEGSVQEGPSIADSRLQMAGTVGVMGQSVGMSQIMLDGKVYLQYDQDPLGVPGQWYWMDFDLSGVQSSQGGNPSEYLQYMTAYSTIEELEDETIIGSKCRHYHLTIDPNKVADLAVQNYEQMAGQMPGAAAEAFDSEQLRAIYAGSDITVDVYIDKDSGLPVRQVLWLDLGGELPTTFEITMDFFDFDEPIVIEAPAGAVPLPVELGGKTL